MNLQGLKLKFFITDNPELRDAIFKRLAELNVDMQYASSTVEAVYITVQPRRQGLAIPYVNTWYGLGSQALSDYKEATIADLYPFPKPTHIIKIDDDIEFEMSDETFLNFKKQFMDKS